MTFSNLPSMQTLTRWLYEEVVVLNEKEAEVFLKYIILPKLIKGEISNTEIKELVNKLKDLDFNFTLLNTFELALSSQPFSK